MWNNHLLTLQPKVLNVLQIPNDLNLLATTLLGAQLKVF